MDTHFIPLESIQIATPCRADWDKMTGDDQARFCGSCAKNVYNFSAMTRAQAEQLILEKEGHLCVRLHRRADGTVITSDCPVGVSRVQRSAGMLRGLIASAVAAVLYSLGLQAASAAHQNEPVMTAGTMSAPMMGSVPAPQPTPVHHLTKPKAKVVAKTNSHLKNTGTKTRAVQSKRHGK